MRGIGRRFQKGQSGNPRGRPKASANLRALLLNRYGHDAAALVDRLDALTRHRSPKVALQALQLLLAYHSGRPTHQIDIATHAPVPLFALPPGTRVDMGGGPTDVRGLVARGVSGSAAAGTTVPRQPRG
jgi:hypothetical protein